MGAQRACFGAGAFVAALRPGVEQHAGQDAGLVVSGGPQREAQRVVGAQRLGEAADLSKQHAEHVVPGAVAHVPLPHLVVALGFELLHPLGERHRLRHVCMRSGGHCGAQTVLCEGSSGILAALPMYSLLSQAPGDGGQAEPW